MCKLCDKNYIGRTTRFLRQRVNEHHAMFYKLLSDPREELLNPNDTNGYCLGRHSIDNHCCVDTNDFNSSIQVFILLNSSPRTSDVNSSINGFSIVRLSNLLELSIQ